MRKSLRQQCRIHQEHECRWNAAIGQPYGIDMASQSIDFYIGLVRLFALATLALCFCSDELRRVASFGNSAVLLLGIACGVALVIPWSVWLFFSRPRTSTPIHRLRDRCAHRSKPHPNCCYKRLHQLRLSTRCEHCTQLGRLARRL